MPRPLSSSPRRVLVAGVTGVGKTTLARQIAAAIDAPYLELDSLYHGPEWTYRESFLPEVRALADSAAWVTEWQYTSARPILVARAELLVWLDLPDRVMLWRLVRRTIRRRVRREVLWNGNREGPLRDFFTGRDHIVKWALSTRRKYREIIPQAVIDHPGLEVVRLHRQRDVDRWLAALRLERG